MVQTSKLNSQCGMGNVRLQHIMGLLHGSNVLQLHLMEGVAEVVVTVVSVAVEGVVTDVVEDEEVWVAAAVEVSPILDHMM